MNTPLSFYTETIQGLAPGGQAVFDRFELERAVGTAELFPGSFWHPPDRLMELIVGSAIEFRYTEDLVRGHVTFQRLARPLNDGTRSYVSPDRRHLYETDGLVYRLIEQPVHGLKPLPEVHDQSGERFA